MITKDKLLQSGTSVSFFYLLKTFKPNSIVCLVFSGTASSFLIVFTGFLIQKHVGPHFVFIWIMHYSLGREKIMAN